MCFDPSAHECEDLRLVFAAGAFGFRPRYFTPTTRNGKWSGDFGVLAGTRPFKMDYIMRLHATLTRA